MAPAAYVISQSTRSSVRMMNSIGFAIRVQSVCLRSAVKSFNNNIGPSGYVPPVKPVHPLARFTLYTRARGFACCTAQE